MHIENTTIFEVKVLTPNRFGDERGFFSESWNKDLMEKAGFNYDFVQDNHSISEQAGTVRGLHFQAPPHAQAKLVRCGQGCLFDVAVDFRNGSPTFGQWVGVELSADNGKQLLIPVGFLHGFVARTAKTEIIYKCTDYYAPEADNTIWYDDPSIGIEWGLKGEAILSRKDKQAPLLQDIKSPFSWVEER